MVTSEPCAAPQVPASCHPCIALAAAGEGPRVSVPQLLLSACVPGCRAAQPMSWGRPQCDAALELRWELPIHVVGGGGGVGCACCAIGDVREGRVRGKGVCSPWLLRSWTALH